MRLSVKPRHKEEKKLADKELVQRLNTDTAILIVLTSTIGVVTAIMVSLTPVLVTTTYADKNAGYILYTY